jgi:hypothetical protein
MIMESKAQLFLNEDFIDLTEKDKELIAFLLYIEEEIEFNEVIINFSYVGERGAIKSKIKQLYYKEVRKSGFETESFESFLSLFKETSKKNIIIDHSETDCNMLMESFVVFKNRGYSIEDEFIEFNFSKDFLEILK